MIWGFYWRVQGESGVDLLHVGPFRAVTDWLRQLPPPSRSPSWSRSLLVFVAITSTVGYVLAFWNFRLVRHDGGTLQVTRGLLTTRATSIERRRLVGVELSEPLLLRRSARPAPSPSPPGCAPGAAPSAAARCCCRPRRAASPTGGRRAGAGRLAGGHRAAAPRTDRRPPPADRPGRAARRCLLVAGAVARLAVGAPAVAGRGRRRVLLLAAFRSGVDRYRSLGHARVDGYLVTRFGSLVRRRTALAETR